MLSTLNSVITGALAMGNFGLEKAIYFQLILLGVFVVATLVGYKLIQTFRRFCTPRLCRV